MRRLRVAYLPASLRPGGAEKQMMALAERLPREQFQVDFVSISGAGAYDVAASAAGARIRSLGSAPPPDSSIPARMVRRVTKLIRFAAIARAARYDIVDAWLYPADVMAALLRDVTGTPIVVAGRRNLGDFHGELGTLELRIAALANRRVDAVVANSAAVAEDTIRRGQVDPAKVHVIRNGVELIAPLSHAERASARARFGAGDSDVLIGCIANYRPIKRLDMVIDAFALIAADDPGLRLVLVGEGPQRPELEGQIDALGLRQRIRLHGAELDPRPLYGAFDMVVQGSRSEGLPNAMLEAAAAGRPIVATGAGGTAEIVIDGGTGLLVPAEDIGALAAAMRQLAADPALRERFGAAAREHVAVTFGMGRYVTEFADLYLGLAAAKGLDR